MERNTFFCNLGLYIKSVLVLILLLGGSGSAWADDYPIYIWNGSSLMSGWTASNTSIGSGYIYSWGAANITSSASVTFTAGQTIVIYAKTKLVSNDRVLRVSKYSDSKWNVISEWNYSSFPASNEDVQAYVVENIAGDFQWKIDFNRLQISSIEITAPTTTPKPTSFSKSIVTDNSASLSWTAGGVEENWQIKYNAGSDFNPATEGLMAADDPIEDNSYVLSGLNELTTYYAYVRAYIDESTQSGWTGPLSFTTLAEYPAPTKFNLDGFTATTATFSWVNGEGTEATKWQIKYSTTQGFNPDETGTLESGIEDNPFTLSGLTMGTTYYARIRADYGDNHYSAWNTTEVEFTPMTVWEDFSSGIPNTWYNEGFVTNRSGYEGQAYTSSSGNVLRTPRLYAEAGNELFFSVKLGGGNLTARYYKDNRGSSTTIEKYSSSGLKTFTAPSTGYYWLEFTGAYNGAVDNFSGFTIADTENLMELGNSTMSTSGTVGGDYTAKVPLRELGGNTETYTAQLYYDGVKVAEIENATIDGNRDVTVNLTFTPSEAKESKPMYIKIIYNDGESELTTPTTDVTMLPTEFIFDETGVISKPTKTFTTKVAQLKYTAKHGWNTICVPFYLNSTYLEQIFGEGCVVYTISSYEIDNKGNGILSFTKKTSNFEPSTPFLVYTENEDKVASNIYLKNASYNPDDDGSSNKTQTKGDASFIGTFEPMAAGSLTGKYGITNEGKLGKGSSSATIKGYRAYIDISGEAPSRLSVAINDDTTTDLGFVRLIDKDAKDIYNLQGQKVKKAGKGIYVVNGRKVIIK